MKRCRITEYTAAKLSTAVFLRITSNMATRGYKKLRREQHGQNGVGILQHLKVRGASEEPGVTRGRCPKWVGCDLYGKRGCVDLELGLLLDTWPLSITLRIAVYLSNAP